MINKKISTFNFQLLAILIVFIALFSISCKNKSTQSSDFSAIDNVVVDPEADFTQFVGKTIRSKQALEATGSYFWAEFTEDGIKYGAGGESIKPNPYSSEVSVSKSALKNKTATFSGTGSAGEQKGSITFENNGNVITKVSVKFTTGTSYTGQTIDCQFLN